MCKVWHTVCRCVQKCNTLLCARQKSVQDFWPPSPNLCRGVKVKAVDICIWSAAGHFLKPVGNKTTCSSSLIWKTLPASITWQIWINVTPTTFQNTNTTFFLPIGHCKLLWYRPISLRLASAEWKTHWQSNEWYPSNLATALCVWCVVHWGLTNQMAINFCHAISCQALMWPN